MSPVSRGRVSAEMTVGEVWSREGGFGLLGEVVEAESGRPAARSRGKFVIAGWSTSPARAHNFGGAQCVDLGKVLVTSPVDPACKPLEDCGRTSEGILHRAPRTYICTDWYRYRPGAVGVNKYLYR